MLNYARVIPTRETFSRLARAIPSLEGQEGAAEQRRFFESRIEYSSSTRRVAMPSASAVHSVVTRFLVVHFIQAFFSAQR